MMSLLLAACIGDSLTYGVGSNVSYPQWLARLTGAEVVNMGAKGSTTDYWASQPQPQYPAVFVMIGHNDTDWWNASYKYQRLADKLFSSNTVQRVYWAPPILDRDGAYFQQCTWQDQALKSVIVHNRTLGRDIVYVDTLHTTYTYSDHVHLDDAGYEKLADVFYSAVR